MLSRLQQSLIAVVAVVVLGLLWFVGNDKGDVVPVETGAAPSSQPASIPRGIPVTARSTRSASTPSVPPTSCPNTRPMACLPTIATMQARLTTAIAARPHRRRRGQRHPARRRQQRVPGNPHQQPGELVRANLLRRQICGPAGRVCEVEARATMVRRGQKVAVECTGAGQGEGGVPLLNDCLIRGGAN
jgi:hypothetical protein